jgi:cytochrome c556
MAVVGAVTALTPAFADNIDDAIKARQGFYQVVSHNAGALFAMAKGDVEYNAETATTHAKNLEILANMDTSSMWLPGSSKEDRKGKTRALPVIWTTFPAIGEKSQAFKDASAKLAMAAGEGIDGLRANIGALGASCKGCHETYRAKDF